jgi:hypothetical protein
MGTAVRGVPYPLVGHTTTTTTTTAAAAVTLFYSYFAVAILVLPYICI